ncbi:hypothetical protein ACJDU8_23960 [Clostridium sp. WILCCON 0269]|uniref:Uncharacterized protein n=1 Tax=Candidatus Clostridium eludens TaxID=3381663 RepID=A0ABW8STL3_9CLOT
MINKRVYMRLSKIAIATIIVTSLGGVAYAKDGDIYNISTTPITDEGSIDNRTTLFDLILNMSSYGYEISNEIYKASDINNAFKANPTEAIDTIYSDIKTHLTPIMDVPQTTLTVSSTNAISATSFQVKFSSAPDDISKVTFNVTREGTPVTLTTSWDSTNTIATLAYSSDLPEDTYAVGVKDGSTDLGTTNISVTVQKIAKIEITSTILGVSTPITCTT